MQVGTPLLISRQVVSPSPLPRNSKPRAHTRPIPIDIPPDAADRLERWREWLNEQGFEVILLDVTPIAGDRRLARRSSGRRCEARGKGRDKLAEHDGETIPIPLPRAEVPGYGLLEVAPWRSAKTGELL